MTDVVLTGYISRGIPIRKYQTNMGFLDSLGERALAAPGF
jgi:hypothetical protein